MIHLGLMLRRILIVAVLAGLPFSAAIAKGPRTSAPAVGDPAPEFALRDQAGKLVTLSEQRGRKVVLVFYRGYW